MIGAVEVALAVTLGLFGALLARMAYATAGPYRRIHRLPVRPVAELARGNATVVGTLRARDAPLRTITDAAAIAIRTQIAYTYDQGSEGYSRPGALDAVAVADGVEVSDASGACALELSDFLLLGPRVSRTYAAAAFVQAFPALWAACKQPTAAETPTDVTVVQTFVPDGVRGFVSGDAVPDEAAAPGDDYRSARQRWRLRGWQRGQTHRPLVVSAWSRAEVGRYLLRPVVLLAWLAAVCWVSAATLLVVVHALGTLGGG